MTPVSIQLEPAGAWYPGELRRTADGSLAVILAGRDDELGPEDVYYIRGNDKTDEMLLAEADEAGFLVIYN